MSDLSALYREYETLKLRGLSIDMTRGVPSKEQTDLSKIMLYMTDTQVGGIDCLNYGALEGLPEARELFAAYLDTVPEEVIVGGNSSLALMHDVVAHARLRGVPGDDRNVWQGRCAFLCPVPGYDRHFSVCKSLGIDMIPVRMTVSGPDMEQVQKLVVADSLVAAMWCTPVYSNPTGCIYSDEVVSRLASMKVVNRGFRILWDKAYAVHDLTDTPARCLDIRKECLKHGTEDRVIQFCSTSKITWAGAGIAALSASPRNIAWFREWLFAQTIGPDKLNQLRHLRFFKNMDGIRALMAEHRKILKPKFDAVDAALRMRLHNGETATWTRPLGGYFINYDVEPHCARRVVELAAGIGVKLTKAGATYPCGDPNDSNIRIAPTCLSKEDAADAAEVVALCTQIASLEKKEAG